MVEPPDASGRFTLSAEASEEQTSSARKIAGWLIECGAK